jgi:hypothetical protein
MCGLCGNHIVVKTAVVEKFISAEQPYLILCSKYDTPLWYDSRSRVYDGMVALPGSW